jgi:predicted NodU family carbamoyl transferase
MAFQGFYAHVYSENTPMGMVIRYSDHLAALEAERKGWREQHEKDLADNQKICLKLDEIRKQNVALEAVIKEKDENFNKIVEVWQMKFDSQIEQISALTAENQKLRDALVHISEYWNQDEAWERVSQTP